MILRRDRRLPEPLAAHLAPRDAPLASAELADGTWAVVARAALVVVGPGGTLIRSPWHEVERGAWDGDESVLTVTWVDGARPPLELRVEDAPSAERFTRALRERVQSSLVHSETAEMPGGAIVMVHIRRDEDGALFSQVTARGHLRDDAEERRLVDELERHARAAVGLAT